MPKENIDDMVNDIVDEHLTTTFKLMSDGFKKLGAKKFNKTLVSIIVSDELDKNNHVDVINFIIKCVIEEFKPYKITKEDVFETKKRGEITIARKMAVIVIKSNLKITDKTLSGFFGGRCRQVVYNILREYAKLDIQNKVDSKFIDKYNRIDEKVKKYLLSININKAD
jgi:chromosomal replication initiation ATPase DnaA